jgi:hypothetical protein
LRFQLKYVAWLIAALPQNSFSPASIQACVSISPLIAALQICDTAPYWLAVKGYDTVPYRFVTILPDDAQQSANAASSVNVLLNGTTTRKNRQWIDRHRLIS